MLKHLLTIVLIFFGGFIYLRDAGILSTVSSTVPETKFSNVESVNSNGDWQQENSDNAIPYISIEYCSS